MAPAKKKAGRATSKTDSSNTSGTNTTNNSLNSTSAAGSTKQRVSPQPVSTRPKRHAEKRFYDDIEDERPQHLSSKSAKKKSAAAAARGNNNDNDDDDDEAASISNGNGNNGSGNGRGNPKAGRRGAARHGARHADENGQADHEEEEAGALEVEERASGGRGGGRGGRRSGSGSGRGGGRSRQPRRRTTVTGWRRARYPDEMIGDEDDEDEDEEMGRGGGGGGGLYQEDEQNSDNWAQCDTCKKWRRLPDFVDPDKLPAKWFCTMNKYDPIRANCRAPQEATTSAQPDEDDERDKRRRRESRKADHRRRRQDTDDDDEYVDEDEEEDRGGDYDDEGEGDGVQGGEGFAGKEEEALEYDEEEEARDENLRRFMSAWARRVKGAEKAESRLATSMSTRGKRKLMGDTQWIRCQNCGKWRALLRSMDPSTYVGPGLHFYCLMNTWHESLASCSAPQENHYTVANLFPPQDLPSPPATAANYEEHDDDDVGEEAFVWRGAGMDRGNGGVEDRSESRGYGHHGGFGDVGAWGEDVGGRGGKRAQIKPPAHYNHSYDVQVERDYDYREKNGGEGGCGGQPFLQDEFHF